MTQYLAETEFLDFKNPELALFFKENSEEGQSVKENAIQLYYAIRDGWRYDPYEFQFDKQSVKASIISKKDSGHCISKSILLVAGFRWLNIPSRLCFAKVKNHIATENIEKILGTNELAPHGYVEAYLDGKWVKATPAFNKQLCDKLQVSCLDFNGEEDSVFQEYDKAGAVFMEYLEDYGHFDDVPLDFIVNILEKTYPHLFD